MQLSRLSQGEPQRIRVFFWEDALALKRPRSTHRRPLCPRSATASAPRLEAPRNDRFTCKLRLRLHQVVGTIEHVMTVIAYNIGQRPETRRPKEKNTHPQLRLPGPILHLQPRGFDRLLFPLSGGEGHVCLDMCVSVEASLKPGGSRLQNETTHPVEKKQSGPATRTGLRGD